MAERLQKVIAQAGITSRRKAEQLIIAGKVQVNGKTVTRLGTTVDPAYDQVKVNGKTLRLERKHTYLFYKPPGVITSTSDPKGRSVVTDYFKHIPVRLYPVGRLDYETEGLLLMTNDGGLAHRVTHPRFKIEKGYLARVAGVPQTETLQQLAQGIKLEDGWTVPLHVTLIRAMSSSAWIRLVLHEGRNRQVRRMCEAVGHPVKHLIRDRIGFLRIGALKVGEYRALSSQEIQKLQRRSQN